MSEKENSILDSINEIIDKSDPTQKVIGLLAVLVDTRIRQNSVENSLQHTILLEKITTISSAQGDYEERLADVEHHKSCPLGVDTKHTQLMKDLEPLLFITNYPKLAILMVIGLFALTGLGIDKLIELLTKL